MSRDRPIRMDTPSVPEKEVPPGYKLRFDRWAKRWHWKAPNSCVEHTARGGAEARAAAWTHFRASKAESDRSATIVEATSAPADGAPPEATQFCGASVVRADRSE